MEGRGCLRGFPRRSTASLGAAGPLVSGGLAWSSAIRFVGQLRLDLSVLASRSLDCAGPLRKSKMSR